VPTERPCHFLVIENDPDEVFLINRAFSKVKGPVTVGISRNLSEAKAYLKGAGMYADRSQYPLPDIILSDLHLAIETGFDFLDWIKREPALAEIPVLILTGSSMPGEIERALRMGAAQVILKPSENSSLSTMLDALAVHTSSNRLLISSRSPRGPKAR